MTVEIMLSQEEKETLQNAFDILESYFSECIRHGSTRTKLMEKTHIAYSQLDSFLLEYEDIYE